MSGAKPRPNRTRPDANVRRAARPETRTPAIDRRDPSGRAVPSRDMGGRSASSTAAPPKRPRVRFAPPMEASLLSKVASKSGFLKKQADNEPGKWTKYYFVLKSSTYLYYYNTDLDAEPRGIIDLEFLQDVRFNAECLQRGVGGSDHCFRVTGQMPGEFTDHDDNRTKLRPLYLDTESSEEADSWMDAIANFRFDPERDEEFLDILNTMEDLDAKLTNMTGQAKEIASVSQAVLHKGKEYVCKLRGVAPHDDTGRPRAMTTPEEDIAAALRNIDSLLDEMYAEANQQQRQITLLREREAEYKEKESEFKKREMDFRNHDSRFVQQDKELEKQQRTVEKLQRQVDAFEARQEELVQREREVNASQKELKKRLKDVEKECERKMKDTERDAERKMKELEKEGERRTQEFEKKQKEMDKRQKEMDQKQKKLDKNLLKAPSTTATARFTAAIGSRERVRSIIQDTTAVDTVDQEENNLQLALRPSKAKLKPKSLFKKPGFLKKKHKKNIDAASSEVAVDGYDGGSHLDPQVDEEDVAEDDENDHDQEEDQEAAQHEDRESRDSFSTDDPLSDDAVAELAPYPDISSQLSNIGSSRSASNRDSVDRPSTAEPPRASGVSRSSTASSLGSSQRTSAHATARTSTKSSSHGSERLSLLSSHAISSANVAMADPCAGLPKEWVHKESRSHPGEFYFYNHLTRDTRWEYPSDAVVQEDDNEDKEEDEGDDVRNEDHEKEDKQQVEEEEMTSLAHHDDEIHGERDQIDHPDDDDVDDGDQAGGWVDDEDNNDQEDNNQSDSETESSSNADELASELREFFFEQKDEPVKSCEEPFDNCVSDDLYFQDDRNDRDLTDDRGSYADDHTQQQDHFARTSSFNTDGALSPMDLTERITDDCLSFDDYDPLGTPKEEDNETAGIFESPRPSRKSPSPAVSNSPQESPLAFRENLRSPPRESVNSSHSQWTDDRCSSNASLFSAVHADEDEGEEEYDKNAKAKNPKKKMKLWKGKFPKLSKKSKKQTVDLNNADDGDDSLTTPKSRSDTIASVVSEETCQEDHEGEEEDLADAPLAVKKKKGKAWKGKFMKKLPGKPSFGKSKRTVSATSPPPESPGFQEPPRHDLYDGEGGDDDEFDIEDGRCEF